ncbi:hypothetical protein BWL13_02219 [Microbacterium oleivorans]|uniref:hypothetical protein n=1 Tax=Microbacterium oleivorans TaxID=273677 RepID=UPI000975604F|nr:hypothetical protein [Microbacterium oleivorans]AZS44626.1 hypothetical protein BWL13_02219 [Microbacterium oleivorans]
MKSPHAPLAVASMALLLTGCASSPSVDIDAAQTWYDSVVAAESDGPGSIGVAGMQIGPDEPGSEVRIDFAQPMELSRVDVRCFGDVTAAVTVSLTGVTDGIAAKQQEIPCDEEAHTIQIDSAAADGFTVSATSPARTFLHATALQELTVER